MAFSPSFPIHGGPGAEGPARFDFSTNAHAAGPCPAAWAAVQGADATRYPDASHHALREALAAWHGVQPARVLLAASGSEFIQRITAVSQRLAPGPVAVPAQAYGDYARAARACGRAVVALARGDGAARAGDRAHATLRWQADPGSPLGQDDPPAAPPGVGGDAATVLDAVYAPLRLSGPGGDCDAGVAGTGGPRTWDAAARDQAFVLHSPNKALGLCGVRAAYAVAPAGAGWQRWVQALEAAAPSWPLGGQGVALLHSWCGAAAQAWLRESLPLLRRWKAAQAAALQALGCELMPSHTPFFCMRPPAPWTAPRAARARARHGVQVRDAASFGLPGWLRVNTLPPEAQAALLRALQDGPP